jgi:aspartate/methionine/tyrosine aminotransferase
VYIPWLFCLEVVDARQAIKEDKAFGVRRIFDMASRMNDPIDLSLGEPDFDIPEEIKQEGIHWIEGGVTNIP